MHEPTLNDLHDILLPSIPSVWPPALGWWLLALFLLIMIALIVLGARYILRKLPRRRARLQALAELNQLENEYGHQTSPVLIARGISSLLKRCALFTFPREESAGLTGQAWLEYLDSRTKTPYFSTPEGEWLAQVPYTNPNAELISASTLSIEPEQINALISHTRRWINCTMGGKS